MDQWQKTAIVKLQRTAHYVDMRLRQPKELLLFLQVDSTKEMSRQTYDTIIRQLLSLEGVVQVNHEWYGADSDTVAFGDQRRAGMPGMQQRMQYHSVERLDVTSPKYDTEFTNETVSLITYFKDQNGKKVGFVEVVVSFFDLIDKVVEAHWRRTNRAFLVDEKGNILTSTLHLGGWGKGTEKKQFGRDEPLEVQTLAAMQKSVSGTIFGKGSPPDYVSGFYRLAEAPWTMVVIAPGEKVLQPIIALYKYYHIFSGFGILLALFIIRFTTNRSITAIKKVSNAANELARGNFGKSLAVTSRDEIGELTKNFNTMTEQLKEGLQLQEAMNIAHEVQQNLLPQKNYIADGIEISGTSIYCQETGGDYFDFLQSQENPGKIIVAVGDVVGHGIGAALLMATVRALLRSRVSQPGSPAEVISDVNKLLCLDTEISGNFVTLFYLTIDLDSKSISWIRCGHEPAIVYDPEKEEFSELRGKGLALGYDTEWSYCENHRELGQSGLIILVGSDGVWEVENSLGESFGKSRVREVLANNHTSSPDEILQDIVMEIEQFRGNHPQHDDITLAIIKT